MSDIDILIKTKDIGTQNIDEVDKKLENLDETTKKTKTDYEKMVKSMVGAGVALVAARKAWGFISDSITAASSAIEENTKLHTVFSGLTEETNAAVTLLADGYNFSTKEAEKLMAATGDLLSGFGFEKKAALDLSTQVNTLAGDLASFTNIQGGAANASMALTKLLVGETEPAKMLGIVVRQDTKEFKDYVAMLQKTQGVTLLQAKAMTSLKIAIEQSKNAIGDISRTQDSYANQSRKLNAILQDLNVEFGKMFVEMLLPGLKSFSAWINANKDLIITGFKAIGGAIRFAFGPVEAIAYIAELSNQAGKFQKQTADAGKQAEENYNRTYAALRQAGLSAQEFFNITDKMAGSGKIKELYEQQKELKRIIEESNTAMKESQPLDIKYEGAKVKLASATKELNEITTERNFLLGQQLNELIKNADQYGISADVIAKMRKILQGELETSIASAKAIEKRTKAIEANTKATKKQMLANVPTAKSIDVYAESSAYLNETIDLQNQEISLNIENWDNLSGQYRINESEGEKTQRAMDDLNDELERQKEELRETIKGVIGLVGQFLSLIGVSDQVVRGLENIAGGLLKITSGDILGGISGLVGGFADLIGGLFGAKEETKELGEEFLNAKGIIETVRGTTEFWSSYAENTKLLTEYLQDAAKSQEEYNAKVQVTLGHFAAAINSGKSYAAALRENAENFGLLSDMAEEFGFKGNEAFTALLDMQRKVAENEQLVNSIDAFNQLFEANKNLIKGSEEQFNAYATQSIANFDKLIDAGFSHREALLLSAPALQQLQELQQKYGFQVDENTRKLIEEADSLDLFKTDPLTEIVDVLKLIAVQLGVVLPEAAESGAKRAEKAFNDLAKSAITSFENVGATVPTQAPTQPVVPGFANGGSFVVPPGYNNDNFYARFSSGERVTATPAGQPSASRTNITVNIYADEKTTGRDMMKKFVDAYKKNYHGVKEVING